MKFGKSIGSQQGANSDLHYVDYKLLKKRIKDILSFQQAREFAEALSANTEFEAELVREISQVNVCFASRQQDLLQRTAALAEDFQDYGGKGAFVFRPSARAATSASSSSGSAWTPDRPSNDDEGLENGRRGSQHRPASLRTLVEILNGVDQLRKYAVWNAVAVVKILKKRRKQSGFGLEDVAAERAGWLSRQTFFSGSDFAELHAAVESLGHALVRYHLGPGSAASSVSTADQEESQHCPICLDAISDMVELSCNHRFCWKCFVLGPIAHQPGEYRISQCPVCRRETAQTEQQEDTKRISDDEGGCENMLLPNSEGLLTRFLHTYFPKEAPKDRQDSNDLVADDDDEDRDVVSELVRALLADTTNPKNLPCAIDEGQGSREESKKASSSGGCGDFFQTLPPQKSQQEKEMLGAAQKLQWLQLACTGDPLALEVTSYCSLCSEPLLMEVVVTTPCKHYFHRVCIGRLSSPECPLCSCALPFSWFLPDGHPCTERGFRVVPPEQYNPLFPGGPSRGTCGYPLCRPPPMCLHAPTGLVMKSYLHRITQSSTTEADGSCMPHADDASSADSEHAGSSGSESSSEESNSDDDAGARYISVMAKSRERHWAHGVVGRMRLVAAPPRLPDSVAVRPSSAQPTTAAREGVAGGHGDSGASSGQGQGGAGERRNLSTVLLIGDRL